MLLILAVRDDSETVALIAAVIKTVTHNVLPFGSVGPALFPLRLGLQLSAITADGVQL